MRKLWFVFLLIVMAVSPCLAASAPKKQDPWAGIKSRLVKDGFDRGYVNSIFADKRMVYSASVMARKLNALMSSRLKRKQPKTKAKEPEVYDKYLNPLLLAVAYVHYRDNKELLAGARDKYQVPGEVVTAILLIETKLGKTMGEAKGANILAAMAASGDLKSVEPAMMKKYRPTTGKDRKWLAGKAKARSEWAYKEFKALLAYSKELDIDPLSIPSSPYGAIGICQFMPSNAEHYGSDGDGDGQVDLFVLEDAVHSTANFLRKHGWKKKMTEKQKLRVIHRYNHSWTYARTVLAVSKKLSAMDSLLSVD